MEYLFHGSQVNLCPGQYLKPRVSFDYEPLVYATDDYIYALVRSGKFDIEDCAIKEDYSRKNCIFTLVELRKNAFRDIFDTDGVIYWVDKSDFTKNNDVDYVSPNRVKIIDKTYIPNVWEEMQKHSGRFRFVSFDDCDRYFLENEIDKDMYMERRKYRVEKLKKKLC